VTLVKLLHRWGYDVAAAGSVKAAFSFLAHFRFDALVSDIGLPDGNGLQVVAELKRRTKATLAVALTAYGDASDKESGRRAGFDHYLTKPLDAGQLRFVLAQA
jgi:CheY-like chemotaxis protein